MSEQLLRELEQLTGQSLPQDYLHLLRNYPSALTVARRCIDNTDSEGMVADVELISDVHSLVIINREARLDSVPDPEGMEIFWPEQFLVIGETGSGDYYCIDVLAEITGVMQYNHQSVSFDVIADSLEEFVDMLMETFVENPPPEGSLSGNND